MTGSGHGRAKASLGPVANRDAMGSRAAFEEAWRDLRPRIERLLWTKGVKSDVVDDVAQETAIKLYANWDRVDPERPLWPLARTIALNCLVDQFRVPAAEPVGTLPDEPASYDVEEHGLARARLKNVAGVMRTLRPKDRSLLLAEVDQPPADRSTSAYKMARLRARKRLTEALDRSATAFGAVPLGLRRLAVWFQGTPGGESYIAALTGATVAATVVVASVVPSVPAAPFRDVRKTKVVHNTRADSNRRRPPADTRGKRSHQGGTSPAPQAKTAAAAPTHEPTPTEKPASERQETQVADAGGRSAKAGSGPGYDYVVVCDEDGSEGVAVTYDHGTHDATNDQEEDYCEE